jgi:hypothetical protein
MPVTGWGSSAKARRRMARCPRGTLSSQEGLNKHVRQPMQGACVRGSVHVFAMSASAPVRLSELVVHEICSPRLLRGRAGRGHAPHAGGIHGHVLRSTFRGHRMPSNVTVTFSARLGGGRSWVCVSTAREWSSPPKKKKNRFEVRTSDPELKNILKKKNLRLKKKAETNFFF